MELILQEFLVTKNNNMKYILASLFFSISLSCIAQASNHYELNTAQYEIVSAFLNQEFNYNKTFYLNKFIVVENYSSKFEIDYKNELEFYRKSDSICKTSKDTLRLKLFCPAAFNRKKYKNLFSENDFNYFENNYKNARQEKLIIDIKKVLKTSVPTILEHTEDYYLNRGNYNKSKLRLSKKEFPSMRIKGIYLTENNQIALVFYSMIEEKLPQRKFYAILKKENEIWWRLVGILSK